MLCLPFKTGVRGVVLFWVVVLQTSLAEAVPPPPRQLDADTPAPVGQVVVTEGQPGIIAGTVVVTDTGEPVSDAVVFLFISTRAQSGERYVHGDGMSKVRTDSKGTFRFEGLPEMSFGFDVRHPSLLLADKPEPSTLNRGQHITDIVLAMKPGGAITGRVYDKKTGEGLPEVVVNLGGSDECLTGEDGAYRFEGLSNGQYEITRGTAPGYAEMVHSERKRVPVSPEQVVEGIDFPLERAVSLSGWVVDGTGKAIEGVPLVFWVVNGPGIEVITDKEGHFRATGFPPHAEVSCHVRRDAPALVADPEAEFTLAGKDMSKMLITVQAAASYSGLVVTPTGNGVPGARVNGVETDAMGAFARTGLYPGTHELLLDPPVGTTGTRPPAVSLGIIELSPGQHLTGLRFVYDPYGGESIAGYVRDSLGNPLPGVAFAVMQAGSQARAVTDDIGYFSVAGLQPGQYELAYFDYEGRTYYKSTHAKAGDQNVEIVLELEPPVVSGGPVGGQVLSAKDGAPVTVFRHELKPGVYEMFDPESRYQDFWGTIHLPLVHQVVDAQGRFEFPTYQEGVHTLLIMAEGHGPHLALVAAGTEGNLIRLQPGATLTGRVLAPSGEPVSGAMLIRGLQPYLHMLPELDQGRTLGQASDDGAFEIRDMAPGAQLVSAVHREFGCVSQTVTLTPGGNASTTFQFPPTGTVAGQVTFEGQPVENVDVMLYLEDEYRGNFRTDAEGSYRVAGLLPGKWRVQFRVDRDISASGLHWMCDRDAELAAGAETRLDLAFADGATTLYGKVTLDGRPIAVECRVWLGFADQEVFCTKTVELSRDGSYRIDGLLPGEVTVRFPASWGDIKFDHREFTLTLPSSGEVAHDVQLTTKP